MIDFDKLTHELIQQNVERPNKADAGTLSGHAAGEPFEKLVYHRLKEEYPQKIFKQHEYLNDLYRRFPQHITAEQRRSLFDSPTMMFLLSRGKQATAAWSEDNPFEEKQNDTADILCHDKDFFELIDVKTRNVQKNAQAPNIISAYKLAQACALMIDNKDFDRFTMEYVEVDWQEEGNYLKCVNAQHANLFKTNPKELYINWSAALQIQFHVCELGQKWVGSKDEWAHLYIKEFVKSAKQRCKKMKEQFITPFLPYIQK